MQQKLQRRRIVALFMALMMVFSTFSGIGPLNVIATGGNDCDALTWETLVAEGYLSTNIHTDNLSVVDNNLVLTGRTDNGHGINVSVAALRATFGAHDIAFHFTFDPPLVSTPESNHGVVLLGAGDTDGAIATWNPGDSVVMTLPAANPGGGGAWGVTAGIRLVINAATGAHHDVVLTDIRMNGESIVCDCNVVCSVCNENPCECPPPTYLFDLADWLDGRAYGVITTNLAPFVPAQGSGVIVSVTTAGLHMDVTEQNWGGVDLMATDARFDGGFQEGDVITATATSPVAGAQLFMQVDSAAAEWADQRIGALVNLPGTFTHTLTAEEAATINSTTIAPASAIRIRLNNAGATGSFTLTSLTVQRPADDAPVYHTVTFGANLTAMVGTASILTGATVAALSTVSFTASPPALGYTPAWTITDGVTLTGEATALTRTVVGLDRNITVGVTFTPPAPPTPVLVSFTAPTIAVDRALNLDAVPARATSVPAVFQYGTATTMTVTWETPVWSPTQGAQNRFTWTAVLPAGYTNPNNIALTGYIDIMTYDPDFVLEDYYTVFFGENISVTAYYDGYKIVVPVSGTSVASLSILTFTATPPAVGYIPVWTVSPAGVTLTPVDGNPLVQSSAPLMSNIEVTVAFTPPPTYYTVTFGDYLTATVGGNAITSPAQVIEGATVIFVATPPTGYTLTGWTTTPADLVLTGAATAATRSVESLAGNITVNVTVAPTAPPETDALWCLSVQPNVANVALYSEATINADSPVLVRSSAAPVTINNGVMTITNRSGAGGSDGVFLNLPALGINPANPANTYVVTIGGLNPAGGRFRVQGRTGATPPASIQLPDALHTVPLNTSTTGRFDVSFVVGSPQLGAWEGPLLRLNTNADAINADLTIDTLTVKQVDPIWSLDNPADVGALPFNQGNLAALSETNINADSPVLVRVSDAPVAINDGVLTITDRVSGSNGVFLNLPALGINPANPANTYIVRIGGLQPTTANANFRVQGRNAATPPASVNLPGFLHTVPANTSTTGRFDVTFVVGSPQVGAWVGPLLRLETNAAAATEVLTIDTLVVYQIAQDGPYQPGYPEGIVAVSSTTVTLVCPEITDQPETATLAVAVVPDNADAEDYKIVWTVADETVATLSAVADDALSLSATVTAVSAGTTTVSALLVSTVDDGSVGEPVYFTVMVVDEIDIYDNFEPDDDYRDVLLRDPEDNIIGVIRYNVNVTTITDEYDEITGFLVTVTVIESEGPQTSHTFNVELNLRVRVGSEIELPVTASVTVAIDGDGEGVGEYILTPATVLQKFAEFSNTEEGEEAIAYALGVPVADIPWASVFSNLEVMGAVVDPITQEEDWRNEVRKLLLGLVAMLAMTVSVTGLDAYGEPLPMYDLDGQPYYWVTQETLDELKAALATFGFVTAEELEADPATWTLFNATSVMQLDQAIAALQEAMTLFNTQRRQGLDEPQVLFNLREFLAANPTANFAALSGELMPHGIAITVHQNDEGDVDTTATGAIATQTVPVHAVHSPAGGSHRVISITGRTAAQSGLMIDGLQPDDIIEVTMMQPDNIAGPLSYAGGGGAWGSRFDMWFHSAGEDPEQVGNIETFTGHRQLHDASRHTHAGTGNAAFSLLPNMVLESRLDIPEGEAGQLLGHHPLFDHWDPQHRAGIPALVAPPGTASARIVVNRGAWGAAVVDGAPDGTNAQSANVWGAGAAMIPHANIHVYQILILGEREDVTPVYNATLTATGNAFTSQLLGYDVDAIPPAVFTVTNTGNQPLTNLAVQMAGTNAASFAIVDALAATPLAPGATRQFSVRPVTGLAAGSFTATVTVNATNLTAPTPINLTFAVTAEATPVEITTTTLPGGTVGTAYTANVAVNTDATGPLAWSLIGNLPAGLTLNTSTGAITGTPTEASPEDGPVPFTIRVTGPGAGNYDEATFTIAIAEGGGGNLDPYGLAVFAFTQNPSAETIPAAQLLSLRQWVATGGFNPTAADTARRATFPAVFANTVANFDTMLYLADGTQYGLAVFAFTQNPSAETIPAAQLLSLRQWVATGSFNPTAADTARRATFPAVFANTVANFDTPLYVQP
ncbi:MAG: putative Ig domain-containing protein [Defluviitaleaceae bacterium]|nr:putative Ig domain-containing protein [Defluviitaleaceae bacterium]MCL2263444.1 putative Ig domain-containing protein [Defluviitaleaceae bacterium]